MSTINKTSIIIFAHSNAIAQIQTVIESTLKSKFKGP